MMNAIRIVLASVELHGATLADLLSNMISALRAGDYQHEAEEVVSIKRRRLSVFGLHRVAA